MTTTAADPFAEMIGQDKVKRKLNFYSRGNQTRGFIPAILLNGAKGIGKTEFAKQFGKSLKKPFIELNCASIKNEETFFEGLFMNHILDKEVTVLFDECHELPVKLMTTLLTVFNPEGAASKTLGWRDHNFEFNFRKQTYVFATTEEHKLFGPFKDRMNKVDFAAYDRQELIDIIKKKADWVQFQGRALEFAGNSLRGNARSAVARATEIMLYCDNESKHTFDLADWESLASTLDLHPYGLTITEVQVLEILRERGSCTLQMIAAATGMSREAIQKAAEVHLLKEGLMKIDVKREITDKGRDILKQIKA